MSSSLTITPILININQTNLYAAAMLGCLVLVLLAVISSQKNKKITQHSLNELTY
jgi:hypothetical protein